MRLILLIIIVMLPVTICCGGEPPSLKDRRAKESYSLGYEFGNNLKRQEADLDVEVLIAAMREALESKKPNMPPDEIRDTLRQLRVSILARQERREREKAARYEEEGRAFLAENKEKPGVSVLASGLQYKVMREGTGPSPKATDMVTVHYRGTLIDGTEFDSSYRREQPQTVHVQGVIPGWTEALQHMKVGDQWQLFISPELAYGKRSFGRIPPNNALIFEVELLSIAAASDRDPGSDKHEPGE